MNEQRVPQALRRLPAPLLALIVGPLTDAAAGLLARWVRRRADRPAWAALALAALAGLALNGLLWNQLATTGLAIGRALGAALSSGPAAIVWAWRDIGWFWILTLPLAPFLALVHAWRDLRRTIPAVAAAPRAPTASASPAEQLVLGANLGGDLYDWTAGAHLTYPPEILGRHLVVVGGSGSGKTETLLRIAAGAATVYGWQVIYLDAKGDYATAARFVAAMQSAGLQRVACFPAQAYDGWRGDDVALFNRLMALEDYSEPYYKSVAKLLLDLAVGAPPAPPRTSTDLLARLKLDELKRRYAGQPEADDLAAITAAEARGAYQRYRAFFAALRGKLDGAWAYEDVDAAYVLLDGLALKEEATSLGRYLLEDFAHYVARRKARDQHVLFVVDEFSALAGGADAANLFERVRSYGAAVVVSSQSYAGLGLGADRILDAAATLLLHQCADPERLVARAGTRKQLELSIQLDQRGATGMGSGRMQDTFRVRPDQARQLAPGECFVIAGGRAAKVHVAQLQVPDAAVRAAGQRIMAPPPAPAQRSAHAAARADLPTVGQGSDDEPII